MAHPPRQAPAAQQARHYLDHEQAFRLGFLPTEQPHPRTVGLAETAFEDIAAGIRMLQSVDADLPDAARRVFDGAGAPAFRRLVDSMTTTFQRGGRVFFIGCGATGRLSIQFEACWRAFWQDRDDPTDMASRVISIMAGGDYALIRSVEGFEDFADFGRHQLAQAGVKADDTVVAITEGGETSFVIGAAWQGVDAGAKTFFVFNNPADILRQHVERSRQIIDEPRITKLELFSGSMAVAGSTRMQATTLEMLVVGAALEKSLLTLLGGESEPAAAYADRFERLLVDLRDSDNVKAIAALTEFEEQLYRRKGLVTYFADACLIDILTDTTERSPTFSLPPFRPDDDRDSAQSWSFIQSPIYDTPGAWRRLLRRDPRGLDWTADDYRRMNAPQTLQARPPRLDRQALLAFPIGRDPVPSRYEGVPSAAIAVLVGPEIQTFTAPDHSFAQGFRTLAAPFDHQAAICIGRVRLSSPREEPGERAPEGLPRPGHTFHIRCELPPSPLDLWSHLAVKLVFNTLSTATMARVGRMVSNWMVFVNTSNKKLIDRGIRLIRDQTGVEYDDACHALFETLDQLDDPAAAVRRGLSPVAMTIQRLRNTTPSETG